MRFIGKITDMIFNRKKTIDSTPDDTVALIDFNKILNPKLHIDHYLDCHLSNNADRIFSYGAGVDFKVRITDKTGDIIDLTEGRLVNQGIQKNHSKKLLSFGFNNINVIEKYRRKGACTIFITDIILTLIKSKPEEDFIFWLTNTSQTIIDENSAVQYKIYDSILNKICTKDKRVQYKIFSAEERINDIKYLEELLIRKQSYLIDEIG